MNLETLLLNVSNLVLGIAVVIFLAVLCYGAGCDFLPRLRRRWPARDFDREWKEFMASQGKQPLVTPGASITSTAGRR
jgi:hypothetical protein